MPPVNRWPEPMAPTSLLASWLAAVTALPLSLFSASAGQGLGAMLAGGGWIGICVPWDRQAWALVNQPVLNFASLPSATGYWLGSWVAPLLLAALAIPLSLRLKTLASQLFVVQLAWVATVIGVAWQPSLDPDMSQFTRWLQFRALAPELRWITAVLGAAIAVPIVLRLIALARIARHHMSRARRLALVGLHLVPVPVAWAIASSAILGKIPVESCVLAGVVVLVALAVPFVGYPSALTHAVAPLRGRVFVALIPIAMVFWSVFALAGRPLPDDRAAAILWGRDGSFNNIRSWMAPLSAPWLAPVSTISDDR